MLTWYLDSKTYFRWLRDLGDIWLGNGPSFSLTTNVPLSDSGVARFCPTCIVEEFELKPVEVTD